MFELESSRCTLYCDLITKFPLMLTYNVTSYFVLTDQHHLPLWCHNESCFYQSANTSRIWLCNQTFSLAWKIDIPCIWVKARSYLGFECRCNTLVEIMHEGIFTSGGHGAYFCPIFMKSESCKDNVLYMYYIGFQYYSSRYKTMEEMMKTSF